MTSTTLSDISSTTHLDTSEITVDSYSDRSLDLIGLKLCAAETDISRLADHIVDNDAFSSKLNGKFSNTLSSDTSDSLNDTPVDVRKIFDVVSPFTVDVLETDRSQDALLTRVCRVESAIKTLRAAIVRVWRERDRWREQKIAADQRFTRAADAFQVEVARLKRDTERTHQECQKAISAREAAENTIEQLQNDLVQSVNGLSLLQSTIEEISVDRHKLQLRVDSLKDELTRERQLRSSLEESQAALTQHVRESEAIIEAEREKVRNMAANCSNLKQDGSFAVEKCRQDQQLLMELHEKYQSVRADKENAEALIKSLEAGNRQLATELQTLEIQYSSLNKQLDEMKKIVADRRSLQEQLERENRELHSRLEATESNQSTQQLTADVGSFNAMESDLEAAKNQLKDAILDRNIHQQRCGQLQVQLEELKLKLMEKDDETEKTCSRHQEEVDKLQRELNRLEVEKDRIIRDKVALIDKLNESVGMSASEKSSLESQVHEQKVELQALEGSRRKLDQDNRLLHDEVLALRQQQQSYRNIEQSLNDMSTQGAKQAYDNGLLKSNIKQLQSQLESVPAMLGELAQLRKTNVATEAKYTKLFAELTSKQTLIRQLETQLAQVSATADRHDSDFNLAIKSRDEAVRENERLMNELELCQSSHQQAVESLQQLLASARADNAELSSTLETVVSSHSALQVAIETLQSDIASRDSELGQFRCDLARLTVERDNAVRESELARVAMTTNSETVAKATAPLRHELERLKSENGKLAESMAILEATNERLLADITRIESELTKKSQALEKIKSARELSESDHVQQMAALKDKTDNLRRQLAREKENLAKVNRANNSGARRQLDEANSKASELNRVNAELKRRVAESEHRIRQLGDSNSSLEADNEELRQRVDEQNKKLQLITSRLGELEQSRLKYVSKNKEQAETIEEFIRQMNELKSEIKNLQRPVNNSAASDKQRIVQDRDYEMLLRELNESRASQKEMQRQLAEEKRRTEETIKRAKMMMVAGRKTVSVLADIAESSQSEVDGEVKTLASQLQREQSRCQSLRDKLNQVQGASVRHIESLVRELDALKSQSSARNWTTDSF